MRKLAYLLPGLVAASALAQEGETSLTSSLAAAAESEIASLTSAVSPILLACFSIVVAFVAYKLIKRAIGKA